MISATSTSQITFKTILNFSTVIALIVPLFIIAILVDSSRDAKRIGPVPSSQSPDKISIRQSRRTLLSVAIGAVVEFVSLNFILTAPPDYTGAFPAYDYISPAVQALGLLTLLYIVFVPHVELHISNLRNDPSTARWTLIVGWILDVVILATAVIDLTIGATLVNTYSGYALLALFLVLSGAMLTLTIMISRGHLSISSRESHQAGSRDNISQSPP